MAADTPQVSQEVWLQALEYGLQNDPNSLQLLFERAKVLDALGRDDDAQSAYEAVLAHYPTHFAALNDLGMLLYRRGQAGRALEIFARAVAAHPQEAIGHANLAYMLLRSGDAVAARKHYQYALEFHPDNADAHRGLALAMEQLGESAAAQRHRRLAGTAMPLTTLSFRGEGESIPVLLLVSQSTGNVHFERLLDMRTFLVHKIVVEDAGALPSLPEHRLIINAVGDVDCVPLALRAVENILSRTTMPVINHPSAIERTGREENSHRLALLKGVRTAKVHTLSRHALLEDDIGAKLTALEFALPLLLRTPGYHTGEHFAKIDTWLELTQALHTLPGNEFLVMEFLDVSDAGGMFHKYRMMIVDGLLYPLHAAISSSWKVHFFSADHDHVSRALDKAFLRDPVCHLGQTAVDALQRVCEELHLDYGGIDFAVDPMGKIVVFEANATMVLAQPPDTPGWEYRREAVERIRNAVHRMFLDRSTVTVGAKKHTAFSQ